MGWWTIQQRAIIGMVLCLLSTEPRSNEAPVNVVGSQNIASYGHDPVAYFTDGEARKGEEQFWTVHDGVRRLFSSETSKRLFEHDPERYMPAYGGYCANEIEKGLLLNADPQSWMIVYGRRYLNCPNVFGGVWFNDAVTDITQADDNWLHLTGHLPVQVMPPRKRLMHSDP